MRILVLLVLICFTMNQIVGQNNEKDFNKLYKRIAKKNIFKALNEADSSKISRLKNLLSFYKDFLDEELKFGGKAGFKFDGNENGINDLRNMGIKGSIDKGAYPYEFDFSIDFNRTVNNEDIKQNVSNFDISFDFHPIDQTKQIKKSYDDNGLWLENFVFAKHFTNNYLGIQSRIEVGGGFIFNFFSGDLFNRIKNKKNKNGKNDNNNKLVKSKKVVVKSEEQKMDELILRRGFIEKGVTNFQDLELKPHYEHRDSFFYECLKECYKDNNLLGIQEVEAGTIVKTRERFHRANIKNNSKWRIALLLGVYYEIEDAKAENNILFNMQDTLLTQDFALTNRLRWEVRPTIVWQPRDKYKFKVYPYFKLPFGKTKMMIDGQPRYDYFLDLLTSFDIKVEESFIISLFYRLYYDNTPKSIQLLDFGNVFLTGPKSHRNYGVSLNYSF